MQKIKLSSLILITVLLTLTKEECNDSCKVIIVGAGPAGIAAATKLFENNFTNVLILEAENRIGGRIYTKKFGDALVDLGAEYCHGEKDNIVYKLANEYDLLEGIEIKFNVHYSSKEDVNQSFSYELYNIFLDISDNRSEVVNDSISAGEYLTERYNQDINERYGKSPKELKYAKEIFETFIKSLNGQDGSFSQYYVSAASNYVECEGNPSTIWKSGGYRTILDILIKKYPNPEEQLPIEKNILINKEVTKIIWNNNNDTHSVVIECSDGSLYRADHVIFTPSLGVLKATFQNMFDPPLPTKKINAINKLGIDAVSKIFLHFPERWWSNTNFENVIPVWAEEDKSILLEEFPHGPIKNGRSWLLDVVGFFVVNENNPNVLVAWLTGEFVPDVEGLPDDLIINGYTYILKKFLGSKYSNITNPDAILRNNWYTNSHFRGTYSFETVESRKEGVSQEEILLQPLFSNGKPTLLFAGEATHPTYYSTVHGAIETGHREAQRIIDLYK